MPCIKTGADVYIAAHAAIIHGDLFRVGDTFILTCGGPVATCTMAPQEGAIVHLSVHRYEMIGERSIAMLAADCEPFFYEGLPLLNNPGPGASDAAPQA